MNCPKCGSADVRRSRQETWSDAFQAVCGRQAFRCRSCRFRFHRQEAAGGKTSKQDDSRRGLRRIRPWMVELAIFALLLLIFLAFLRYLTREPVANREGGRALLNLRAWGEATYYPRSGPRPI